MNGRILGTLATTLLLAASFAAQPPVPTLSPAESEAFELKVRPLLARHCLVCHGAQTQSGNLRLDRPIPPELAPKLVAALRYDGPVKMPPAGKLAEPALAALTGWARAGARFPAAHTTPASDGTHWAFHPVVRPAVPPPSQRPVASPSRRGKGETNKGLPVLLPLGSEERAIRPRGKGSQAQGEIDAFVRARLAKAGLAPAPPADRRTLLRRVTFDLTGLPPTPDEVASFLADKSPDAYEKVVDRLLASPAFGERWARYWLDLVRYADTNGYERDAEKPYSWKYRDWVIRALNDDMPYDRFVTEQLAGDEMPDRSASSVVATGLLRLGTWDDEPNDPAEYQYERLDDLVHVASTAFLGLTVRCARCHDHKFDPIPQKDYYALASAFWNGYLQPGDGKLLGGPPPERLGAADVLGFTDSGPSAPPLHLLVAGDYRRPGAEVGPGFLTLAGAPGPTLAPQPGAATTRRRLQLAAWIVDPKNPLTARVAVNRIWQGHFGRGIVASSDNFGLKGDPPTHPELLDWLASELLRNGWRMKPLHRQIVLSKTYRQASLHPAPTKGLRLDPLDTLLWRYPRRRLDADALRDAILAVNGQLNRKAGGRGFVPDVTREALEGLSRKGAEWIPSPPDEQRRRTIYLFLKRALIPPMLGVFDFGDTTAPLAHRDITTVAPQALALLNNPWLHAQADALAVRVAASAGNDRAAQATLAWRLALARSPSSAERAAATAYLAGFEASPAAKVEVGLPTDGLRLWLRADDGVETDPAGHVLRWRDRSGNGFDALARPESAPLLAGGAVRFDGNGAFLSIAQPVLTSQQFTIAAVAADTGPAGQLREIFSNWRREDNIATAVFLGVSGEGVVRLTDFFAPAGALAQPARLHVLTGVAGPDFAAVFQDRRPLARSGAALPGRNLAPPYVVGQQGNIKGEFWNGQINELLVWDRALSAAERERVWDQLAARHPVAPRPAPVDPALASLCRVLLNTNEFLYVD